MAATIVEKLDRSSSAWRKWNGPREDQVKASASCWVLVADLADHLNAMPRRKLTPTDVAQRMRSFQEEGLADYPNEALQEECEALLLREKEQGTELPAIVGALQELIEQEEYRLRTDRAGGRLQSLS